LIQKVVKKSTRKIQKETVFKKKIERNSERTEEKVARKKVDEIIPTVTKKVKKIVVEKKELISKNQRVMIKNDYLLHVKTTIEKNKIYPKRAKKLQQEGRVILAFVIAQDGYIYHLKLKKRSGFSRLDKAALKILHKIKKFKPIPKELQKHKWSIDVPITYSMANI